MIYLDNAATTLRKPQIVYETLYDYTVNHGANALRGTYKESIKSSQVIIEAQNAIAKLFKLNSPQNVVFTQNATYALNMAILGTLKENDHAIVTEMEHNSVLRPVHGICSYTVAKAHGDGFVSPFEIEKAIRPDTKLIAVTHASNVCGTIQDIKTISRIAKKNNIKILIDTAQTAGIEELDNNEIEADFIAFSGHKGLMGPMGTGGLYIKDPDSLESVIKGGTGSESKSINQPQDMPDKFHSGTINTPALSAMTAGINYVLDYGVKNIGEYEKKLSDMLKTELKNMKNVTIYGAQNSIANVAFNINGLDSGYAAEQLTDFALRAGYHCAPFAHKALGTEEIGAIRASFGIFNTSEEVKKLVDCVYKLSKEV